MKTIGIIGAGTMGSGIAQIAATANSNVYIFDKQTEALSKSKEKLEKILTRLVEKNRISEEKKSSITSLITYTTSIDDMASADLVVEAIIENINVKKEVFTQLENLVSEKCILASNTSSLSIASIASCLNKPERCLGLHFFNPAPLMPLVEVIPAVQTNPEIFELVYQLMLDWKKVPVKAKDTPGFIVNRVARPFYGESLRIYEESFGGLPQNTQGFATIDWALKHFGKFKMGPFQLMDFIGNDVNYTVTETVFKAFYFDPRYKPSFTQKRHAEAGYLGKKSGRGFYDYNESAKPTEPLKDEKLGEAIFNRVLVMLINEAADALFLNIASAKDIDLAMTKGVNYPKGLLAWANDKGIDWCVEQMDALYNMYREDRYRCSPMLRQLQAQSKQFQL
ncbi:3-hydroxyacyl-CoA dehydrogenase NAD-binding domain-containing protein [Psychroflexus sp. ALD_RP9]|uniref:3-hydroxyacyl-CoA dehydrogenase NAD-binding domain-containing protein n=1 Tax=Psychroflexus sp. ALD_RP9 TaxID=2777186 RepID=UPI001A8D0F26|nr:3-hydroxyacyl-CoA dehydrogenase NAD-binding domain-containing protein [Psychroflexus sp. ALD_RP9]QSS97663.1 NAD(P)-binding domain-containing protein [Psychroflexus sp. ALD_RP9]